MSYDPRFDNTVPTYPEPRSSSGGMFIGFLFGAGMLIAAGAYLFPVLHKQWNEAEVAQKIKLREADARADADLEFRKTEARLKAEALAAGEKLAKLDVAPSAFRAVAQKAGPSVVNISNIVATNQGQAKMDGSGVIYKIEKDADGLPAGYVVTNSHVVHKYQSQNPYEVADKVGINFVSGRTVYVDSNSIFHDPFFDLAVIKFDASDFDNLVVADWGDSSTCEVGDWVVAIGSPFGLKQSVTTGIISGKGRTELRQVEAEVLQTDAAINPGNSGGPLLDMKGRVIGINVAIATQSGGNNGVGFSIPSNTAKDVINTLMQPPHKIVRGYLGVNIAFPDIDPRITSRAGVDGGALITNVKIGDPGSKAGLQMNDLVIRFKHKDKTSTIRTGDELRQHIRELKPGDMITLEVVRGIFGRPGNIVKVDIEATLSELPRLELEQLPDQFGPRNQQRRPQR